MSAEHTQRGLPHRSWWPSVAPCTHGETRVPGSRTHSLRSHLVKTKALRGTMAHSQWPAWFCAQGTLTQRGSAQSPHSMEWHGEVPGGMLQAGALQHLVSPEPVPASRLSLEEREAAPSGLPARVCLPLVAAASLLCLAWVQPPHTSPLPGNHPAPPSQSPGAT